MVHLVTGAAGFIGSNIAKELVEAGETVIGIDSFTDYYSRRLKEENIKVIINSDNFSFIEGDILEVNLIELLKKVDYVYHQAAQAGVRSSWGNNFQIYIDNNILATQKLLEAARQSKIKKLVYASSSSVYGNTDQLPMREENRLQPISPYGVSKRAAEDLCYLYWKNYQIPIISLRYFTVFGEGQRPDMAFHIFIKAILTGNTVNIYGDGKQSRNFTYVGDIVKANIIAAESDIVGEVFNIGGDGDGIVLNDVISFMEDILQEKADLIYMDGVKGDVKHTSADCSKAKQMLGYKPEIEFKEGLKREIDWMQKIY